MKYKTVVKTEVFIEIRSDYADGLGEADTEVRNIIDRLKQQPEVKEVGCGKIDLMTFNGGKLKRISTECADSVIFISKKGKEIVIDGGVR